MVNPPNENETANGPSGAIPRATIRSADQRRTRQLTTRLWWLTGICTLLAITLVVTSFRSQGTLIDITFSEGHGLKAGDTLRYRGIDIGSVQSVQVSDNLDAVEVAILLSPGNESLAVAGSQFWIERPQLRLGQISGLDTVLGAKYVGVLPGDTTGERRLAFNGLETPLQITQGDSTVVAIRFPAGEGLAVGDPVRYRGIAVGEVTEVELTESLDVVVVRARLVGVAQEFARVGTQFWIERPRLDLTEIRGLETLLGGRYVAVQPTSETANRERDFLGLAEPPPLPRREGCLEIELDASSRFGLVRGAPLTYRGLEVGRVSNVGLSRDGASIKVSCVIEPDYTDLVRNNSHWWVTSGLRVDANLTQGVTASFESLAALMRGGIAFSTPRNPGDLVVTGHRYTLAAVPEDDWLKENPRIAVGKHHLEGVQLPHAFRVVARWDGTLGAMFGLGKRTEETWAIMDEDGLLRIPTTFFDRARSASDEVTIEVGGKGIALVEETASVEGPITRLMPPPDVEIDPWNRFSSWSGTAVLLVVNPELSEPIALDRTRVTIEEGAGIRIAQGVSLSETLIGSPVMDADQLTVIGLLDYDNKTWFIRTYR